MSRSWARTAVLTVLGLVWAGSLLVASVAVWRYKSTPGDGNPAPSQWPAASLVRRAGDRPTLVVLAHPFCPCTRATMTELGELTASLSGKVATRVVFVRPEGTDASWERSSLVRSAQAIPGVETVIDHGGVETNRFGGLSSGYTLLYDKQGKLQFAGGITIARGHEGDSAGSRRIRALVNHQTADGTTAPVFGCSLVDPSACEKEER
jgi:hypothetical protein